MSIDSDIIEAEQHMVISGKNVDLRILLIPPLRSRAKHCLVTDVTGMKCAI